MVHPIPSIFLAIPDGYPSLTVPGHYTQLLCSAPASVILESLQTVSAPPELIVLDAFTLFEGGLGTLTLLKTAVAQSGATLLLVSHLNESLTAWVARATGAHAAVLGSFQDEQFSGLAQLLLSERAVAGAPHKEAAPQPSPRSGYLPVPA